MALAGALTYLYDPPWTGRVTSGLRPWEENPPGTLFRWTTGRASFFVPAEAKAMTLPLLAIFPGPDGAPVRDDNHSTENLCQICGKILFDLRIAGPIFPPRQHQRFQSGPQTEPRMMKIGRPSPIRTIEIVTFSSPPAPRARRPSRETLST